MNFPARAQSARSAPQDDLQALIHESDEETLLALLENPLLEEPHISQMLERLDLSANVLTAIAEKGKWTTSEGVRLRLARHPRTPRRFAMALLRQLYLFDLVRLSLLPSTPAEIRRVAEELMITRVPQLPDWPKTNARSSRSHSRRRRAPRRGPSASDQARASQRVSHREPDPESPGETRRARARRCSHRAASALGRSVQCPRRADSQSAHAHSSCAGVSPQSNAARPERSRRARRRIAARSALYSKGTFAEAGRNTAARRVGNYEF